MEDKILARVRKMMALATDPAATEQERDTALQMSYRLLAKHNLAMIDVENLGKEAQEARERVTSIFEGMIWSRHVANIISEMFFCKYYSGGTANSWKRHHYFVGKQSNATSAMMMSEYIVKSIIKECRKLYKDDSCPQSRSFALGAVDRLRVRVREIIASQKQEHQATPGTSLVLANFYDSEKLANMKFLEGLGVALSKGRAGKGTGDNAAYRSGQAYGNNIGLSPQIKGSGTNYPRLSNP